MKQRLTFLTLGVNDLEKMKTFYSDVFGWKTLKDGDGIVFYRLNGIILGLSGRLKKFSGEVTVAISAIRRRITGSWRIILILKWI
jgi:predicted enzyme related to lactoylglutathione lyase